MSEPYEPSPQLPTARARTVTEALADLVRHVPGSHEPPSRDPEARARALVRSAALRSSVISGSLAVPPGPFGMLTILPDLVAIWHVQRQLVADIAAVFGKQGSLTPEQLLYCLFRHGSAHLLRDVVVRVGERVLVRKASLKLMQSLLQSVGVRVTQRALGRTISRWVPVAGAVGIAGYAWLDTSRVGATAIDLFRREIEIEPAPKG